MVIAMKAATKMIKRMVKELYILLMVISMTVYGLKVVKKAKVF